MKSQPVTIATRATVEKKKIFYDKAKSAGKKPSHVLAELVDDYIK